jgi:hypothetical protein
MSSNITVLNLDKTEFDFSNIKIDTHYNIIIHCVYDPFGDFDNEFAFLRNQNYDQNTLILLWHPVEQGHFEAEWMAKLDAIVSVAKYKLVYLTGCSHELNVDTVYPHKFDLRFFPVFDIRSKDLWRWFDDKQPVTIHKNNKFVFLNSKDTAHRRYVLAHLLGQEGIITYRCKEGLSNTALDFNTNRGFSEDFLIHANAIFDSCLPNIPISIDDGSSPANLGRKVFLDSYLSVVAETQFVNIPYEFNRSFVTEKTFNAIANNQMFIVVGHAHSLKLLHSLGYKTFSEVIDESYDNILDNGQRLKAVTTELVRFVSRPIEQLEQDYTKVVSIIEHNRDLLYSASLEQRLQELVDRL